MTLNKQRAKERVALEGELEVVEKAHKATPTRELQRQLTAIRGKLRSIYTNRAEYTLLKLRQTSYAQGDKVGPHLARQLRVKREREFIGGILYQGGQSIHTEATKANIFGDFYGKLYQGTTPLRAYNNNTLIP